MENKQKVETLRNSTKKSGLFRQDNQQSVRVEVKRPPILQWAVFLSTDFVWRFMTDGLILSYMADKNA